MASETHAIQGADGTRRVGLDVNEAGLWEQDRPEPVFVRVFSETGKPGIWYLWIFCDSEDVWPSWRLASRHRVANRMYDTPHHEVISAVAPRSPHR